MSEGLAALGWFETTPNASGRREIAGEDRCGISMRPHRLFHSDTLFVDLPGQSIQIDIPS